MPLLRIRQSPAKTVGPATGCRRRVVAARNVTVVTEPSSTLASSSFCCCSNWRALRVASSRLPTAKRTSRGPPSRTCFATVSRTFFRLLTATAFITSPETPESVATAFVTRISATNAIIFLLSPTHTYFMMLPPKLHKKDTSLGTLYCFLLHIVHFVGPNVRIERLEAQSKKPQKTTTFTWRSHGSTLTLAGPKFHWTAF